MRMGGVDRKIKSYTGKQYLKALKLLKSGLSQRRVAKLLGIPARTVCNWARGQKPPAAKWEAKPSKELAYVLGVLLGDGTVSSVEPRHRFVIELLAKDYDFVREFSRCLALVLNKPFKEPARKWVRHRSKYYWYVTYYSKAFYLWYKSLDLNNLRKYVEYDKHTVKAFLRGIFDSDGTYTYITTRRRSVIKLYNTNLELMRYIQHLLSEYFAIHSRINYMSTATGKPYYHLTIYRKSSVDRFLREIGFTIARKISKING